jgi:phosphate transport system substrate-binding protein
MLNRLIYFTACSLLILFASCGREDQKLNLNPATLLRPGLLQVKGSDSERALLHYFANAYEAKQQEIQITLDGGGSAVGIESLISGTTDIANSSRLMTREELTRAEKMNINPVSVIIALDAVAVITHPETGIDSLSVNQLAALYSGKIKNWRELGGENLPVVLLSRDDHSGTHLYFLQRLGLDEYIPGTAAQPNNAAVAELVSKIKGAVGYVTASTLIDFNGKPRHDVWAVNMFVEGAKACSPYEIQAVQNGDYPITRPLYQYMNGIPEGEKMDFIRFELADGQQQHLKELGYIPITHIHKAINRRNGFVAE